MLAAVTFAIKYLPLIVAAVTFVQNFADSSTPGEQRKALAVKFVTDTLGKLGVPVNERTVTVIEWLIDLAVMVLNRFGIFESKEGPAPEVVAVASKAAIETRVPALTADELRIQELEAALIRR